MSEHRCLQMNNKLRIRKLELRFIKGWFLMTNKGENEEMCLIESCPWCGQQLGDESIIEEKDGEK